jgi:hypothetical protein
MDGWVILSKGMLHKPSEQLTCKDLFAPSPPPHPQKTRKKKLVVHHQRDVLKSEHQTSNEKSSKTTL